MEDRACVESKFKIQPNNLTKQEENISLFSVTPYNAQFNHRTLEDEAISSLALEQLFWGNIIRYHNK